MSLEDDLIEAANRIAKEGGPVQTIGERCRACGYTYTVYALGRLLAEICPSCGNPSEVMAAARACGRVA